MAKRPVVALLVVLSVCFLLNAPAVQGQAVYGSIIGTVTDAQGAGVAGAKVTVTSTTKGTAQETTTNESGNYSVSHLIPDTYSVKIEATGFKGYDVASVQVSADEAPKVDAQLTVGDVTQSVEVTTEVPQLKTESKDVSIEFNSRYVEDLPILNRNFTNFELLSPGTQKLVGWSHAATENPQGGQQIFVNGQHFSGTAFELDGTDNQDPILGIIVVNPNLDAIQESKISLQNYDAEFGKAVAGVVTVQTKSGTNEIHGGGFYDYRGSGQQARDPFTQSPSAGVPNATYKDFGVDVGLPIIKDKLFVFGDYQGTRQVSGVTNQLTIPTALVQSTCNPAKNPGGMCNLSQYLGNVNGGGQVFDPTTGSTIDGTGRSAFAGNLIPVADISPQAAAILALFPAPTNSSLTNNFDGSGSGSFNQNAMDVRVDYAAPHGYQVFGRFSLDYFNLSGTGVLGALGGLGDGPGGLNGESTVHNYSLASGFDKAIGTTWLTDFRFGYFKYNPQTQYSDAGTNPMTGFGIPGLNLGTPSTTGLSSFFPTINGDNSANGQAQIEGLPNFGDGLNVGRCNCPLTESEQQFQFVNNWTKIKGNHSIKFGADIRYAENLRVPSDANRTGELNFDQLGTGNGTSGGLVLATFLLGQVSELQRFVSSSLTAAERQRRYFFYGQDTWRVTPKLTFNYGLRWEGYSPEYVNGKGNGGFANLSQGVIRVAGFGGVGLNGNIDATNKAFAPRLGIAYQYDPKTVVRIGYGRSFDLGVFGSNFGHVVTQNLPVLANQTVTDSSVNSAATNNRTAVFTLAQGAPAFNFGNIISSISPTGTLPLLGPDGSSGSRIRPTIQRLPTLDAWSATLQRQVTPSLNVEVSYIGNKGTHTIFWNGPSYNPNEIAVGDGTSPYSCAPDGTGTFTCTPKFTPAIAPNNRRRFFSNGIPAFTYPGFSTPAGPLTCCAVDLTYFGNDSSSNYNAIQVKAEKRFTNGLQFLAHYTYSHANGFDTSYYSVNPKIAYGPDPFSRNNVFVASSVYELPFGRGKRFMGDINRAADYLIGGWQISNTLNWSGGLPFTPTINDCSQISDAGPCRPNFNPGVGGFDVGPHKINGVLFEFTPAPTSALGTTLTNVAPGAVAGITGTNSCATARPVFGPFSLPNCGTIGDTQFSSFRGPRVFFDDMSLTKSFTITERVKAQFRFDAFNVFNHVTYGFNINQGNTCIDCGGNSGQITDVEADSSPGSPTGLRQLQFGVRVTF
jgi:Carboxypeptidase regulatory-like domain/TonB dependent receptor-like, beta-barrel